MTNAFWSIVSRYGMSTRTYDTAESLMRLRLPQTGLVFPDRFIPLAEKYGYIHRLSMIILNKTCRQIKQMQDEAIRSPVYP
mgnify:FL=1